MRIDSEITAHLYQQVAADILSSILERGELFAEIQAAMAALSLIGNEVAGDLSSPGEPSYSTLEFRALPSSILGHLCPSVKCSYSGRSTSTDCAFNETCSNGYCSGTVADRGNLIQPMIYGPISVAGACVAVLLVVAMLACSEAPSEATEEQTPDVRHVDVYFEKGRFGGWPANHGIWSWGDEILVGFTRGYYKDMGERHHMDREKPEVHMLARSLDGGETWSIEDPGAKGYLLTEGGFLNGVPRPGVEIPPLQDSPGGIDFMHPDFALTMRTNSIDAGVGRFFYSYERGHTWQGPYRLPNFGAPGIAPRTDYIVNGAGECMLFITAAKENGEEGRPLCVRTTDAGKTWEFVSWIGPEPEGFSIMPASVRLSAEEILVTVRRREGPKRFISAYLSKDNGATFEYLNEPVADAGVGNPPAMIQLADGRICLVYGYRAEPFSIRAKLSNDGGRSWGEDIVLRDDGSSPDVGYPRVVQRPDGKVVVLYYFSRKGPDPERFIAATIWALPGV